MRLLPNNFKITQPYHFPFQHATANPFIIFDIYECIDKIIKEKSLGPEQIWNCDESGFPSDPQKCKVVSIRGQTAYKLTCGAGCDNTSTLAVCNAAGKYLDPLVIFAGKNLQNMWRRTNALPETFYGISENGWMTTEIFYEWFVKFSRQVKDGPSHF
ncbi:uncharacterized protein LOC143470629 [Clavelina lepadiformis]|uniref:uncharacterized protein LOC143470629 n=1 Tax=Clavelina lepadiformis TaxID=159417 RepID=UPI0040433046